MKIREILNEGFADKVAHYYPQHDQNEIDSRYNPEAKYYTDINRQEGANCEDGEIKVMTRPEADGDRWTIEPDNKHYKSAGARGLEHIKKSLNHRR